MRLNEWDCDCYVSTTGTDLMHHATYVDISNVNGDRCAKKMHLMYTLSTVDPESGVLFSVWHFKSERHRIPGLGVKSVGKSLPKLGTLKTLASEVTNDMMDYIGKQRGCGCR